MEQQCKKVICTTLLVETSPQALPLGCACIASAIKQKISDYSQGDTCVEIFDFSPEDNFLVRLNEDQKIVYIAERLIEKKPDVLCFSLYVWNRKILCKVADMVKKALPESLLLAGGAEVTAGPKTFGTNVKNSFDCLISGEGENAVSEIVEAFLKDGTRPSKTVVYSQPYNLENAVSPYLTGVLDTKKYSGALWELARGCPYSCSYCYESKGEKKVRYMPRKRIYEELDFFVEQGVPQVFVLDPTYNVDKKRALEMLQYIEKKAPEIFFHFECRPEFIDSKLANAFSKIHCSLQIGLQSSSEKVLSLVKRAFNKKDFVRNIGLLNETGAVFGFDLIYGLPGDTYEGFTKSIDFALELYPNHLEIFQLSVLPGTDLYDRAKELKISFLEEAPYLVTETATFSKKDIQKAKNLALACSLFYTQGRAVSWFLSLLKPLQKKPVAFLLSFVQFLEQKNISLQNRYSFFEIVNFQKDFIKMQYSQKKANHLIRFAADLIDLNAAISSYIAEGTESQVALNYHPDDLLSPYTQDPKYFVQHAEKFPCVVEISKRAENETGEIFMIVF